MNTALQVLVGLTCVAVMIAIGVWIFAPEPEPDLFQESSDRIDRMEGHAAEILQLERQIQDAREAR